MSAYSFYDDIKSYLKLTTRVVSKVGSNINVGEKFTLRFTGSNSAYSSIIHSRARIVFNDARIFVRGTPYASPVGGSNWHSLPDKKLYPGESSSIDIEFEATANIGSWLDNYLSEKVAKAWIFADLDLDHFFLMMNYMDVFEEIEET
jgi:hypothetical protein